MIKTIKPSQCIVAALAGLLLASSPAFAISFTETTATVGMTELNSSWGASWGDADGDGDPDLWVTNHTQAPTLYINDVDQSGLFIDTTPGFAESFVDDAHGAQWTDFDNDGDQDLIQLGGAGAQLDPSPNRFLVNDGTGVFTEEAVQRLVDLPLGRGRNPLMFDLNNDGLLDLFYTALARNDGQVPAGVYVQQTDGTFVYDAGAFPANPLAPTVAQLTDVTLDGVMEVATYNRDDGPPVQVAWKIFDTVIMPLSELSLFPGTAPGISVLDVAIADFNGDLLPDQFMVRANPDGSDVVQISPTQLQARLHPADGAEGMDIETTGDLYVLIPSNWFWPVEQIYIGANGINPAETTFTLDESNPDHQGLDRFTQGVDVGIYIGYDTATSTWQLRVSCCSELNTLIHSQDPITDIAALGFVYPGEPSRQDYLYTLNNGGFADSTASSGLLLTPCVSVTAGDFDNDMDVDLYLACTRAVTNAPNMLFENDGTGFFTEVPLAGGAEGSELGRGETVISADYDGDGFLDLFVANGNGWPPFNFGPHQLFRNDGNTNHWLQIDLEGTHSNRDGIGARVFVTANGVTQLRERSGGMHLHSQDFHRLHFGLGTNTTANSVTVQWPSGATQVMNNVAADQVIKIREIGPGCEVLMSQPSYVEGETITVSQARYVNPASGIAFDGQIKLSLEIPNGAVFSLLDIGGDGSLTLPAGMILDPAPLSLLTIGQSFPLRGTYTLSCEVLNPAIGRSLTSDSVTFEVL